VHRKSGCEIVTITAVVMRIQDPGLRRHPGCEWMADEAEWWPGLWNVVLEVVTENGRQVDKPLLFIVYSFGISPAFCHPRISHPTP
jgi:hypothetical protein